MKHTSGYNQPLPSAASLRNASIGSTPHLSKQSSGRSSSNSIVAPQIAQVPESRRGGQTRQAKAALPNPRKSQQLPAQSVISLPPKQPSKLESGLTKSDTFMKQNPISNNDIIGYQTFNFNDNRATPDLQKSPQVFRQALDADNLIQVCTQKLQLDKNHQKALFVRAQSYLKKNLPEQTIDDCNRLINLNELNAGAYYIRGCAYDKLNEEEMCIDDFTRVLEIDPGHVNAAYARGAAENKRGNYLQAIQDYNMALKMDTHERSAGVNGFRRQRRDDLNLVLDQSLNTIQQESKQKQTLNIQRVEQFKKMDRDKLLLSPSGGKNQNRVGFGVILNNDDDIVSHVQNSQQQSTFRKSGVALDQSIRQSQNDSVISAQRRTPSVTNTPYSKNKAESLTEGPSDTIQINQLLKQQAENYHSKGYEARKQGDYNQAIQLYTQALEIYPQHFKALFNRGFAFDKQGQYKLAIADYSSAIKVDPQNAFTYYNKGISLDRMGSFNEAIECFSYAIRLQDNKADFYHNRGFAFRKTKDYEKAIEDYSKAITLDGGHFKAYYNRAFCFDKQGKLYQAEEDYLKACKLQPNNVSALHHLGTIREKIGGDRLPYALRDFDEVIQLDQAYAPAFNGRGLVWDRLLHHEEAVTDFTQAIQLDKKNAVYWHNRACCYRNTGRFEEALFDFDKAITLEASNPVIYSNRGLVNRKMERFAAAINDYSNEINFSQSTNLQALNNRAYCFAKLGQYNEAIIDYTKVLQHDKRNIHALHNRGISYERLSQYDNAIRDFTEVIGMDPQNANAYFNRGCCYDSVGELDLAIADYSIALELDEKVQETQSDQNN